MNEAISTALTHHTTSPFTVTASRGKVLTSMPVDIDLVVSVTDGDTLRINYSYLRELTPALSARIYHRQPDGRGTPVRLVTLNTPEKGFPGWKQAAEDMTRWLNAHPALSAELYEDNSGEFGRPLIDIYPRGHRGDTLSQHMLSLGWPPYVEGH